MQCGRGWTKYTHLMYWTLVNDWLFDSLLCTDCSIVANLIQFRAMEGIVSEHLKNLDFERRTCKKLFLIKNSHPMTRWKKKESSPNQKFISQPAVPNDRVKKNGRRDIHRNYFLFKNSHPAHSTIILQNLKEKRYIFMTS